MKHATIEFCEDLNVKNGVQMLCDFLFSAYCLGIINLLWIGKIDEEIFSIEEEQEDGGNGGARFPSSPIWRAAPSL